MQTEDMTLLVIEIVKEQMNNTSMTIEKTTSLQDIAGFDSLVVVGLIDRLENQIGFEMDPSLILPETFATPITLAEAISKSQQRIQSD